MPVNDPALLRTAKAYAKQQYEKETMRPAGAQGLDAIGHPHWNRNAWEQFRASYGRYPSISEGDLPNLQGCPDWAFELMGLRKPPVDVTTGGSSNATTYEGISEGAWDLRGRRA